jgi:hypothetical protein
LQLKGDALRCYFRGSKPQKALAKNICFTFSDKHNTKKLKAFSNFNIHSKIEDYETTDNFFNTILLCISTICPGTFKIGFLQRGQQQAMDFLPEQQPGIVQNNYH